MNSIYNKIYLIIALVFLVSCKNEPQEKLTPPQGISFPKKELNPIDRYGELLVDVQMQQVFSDGKTFVDSKPLWPADTILARYERHKNLPDFKLSNFVEDYFILPESPTASYETDTTRTTAAHIEALWPYLKRAPDEQENGSLIALPNAYIVPGGRFREVYYWDSFFIMLGLKESGEFELMENILDNFAHQINTLGFIPNGNRTYYLNRSQPPFFAEMVKLYASTKNEKEVYLKYLEPLEKEYAFWMQGAEDLNPGEASNRVVKMQDSSLLNRFYSNRADPRAESYREDVLTAREAAGRDSKEVYLNITAACESGWDFSSRWFADPADLSTIQTTQIIPVDLNALMYNMEHLLAIARRHNGDVEGAQKMVQAASSRKDAIDKHLWSESEQTYTDYNLKTKQASRTLSLAMVYPLYFQTASPAQALQVAKVLERDFLKPGGLVTTLHTNGQQWDSPNGWPPHQWMAIRGLQTYGIPELAKKIQVRWLHLNERVYTRTGKMLEKYNVIDTTLVAGGGEYPTQDGFGWTNGVYLDLKQDVN